MTANAMASVHQSIGRKRGGHGAASRGDLAPAPPETDGTERDLPLDGPGLFDPGGVGVSAFIFQKATILDAFVPLRKPALRLDKAEPGPATK